MQLAAAIAAARAAPQRVSLAVLTSGGAGVDASVPAEPRSPRTVRAPAPPDLLVVTLRAGVDVAEYSSQRALDLHASILSVVASDVAVRRTDTVPALQLRDCRMLDAKAVAAHNPTLLVRQSCVVLNMIGVRAILCRDRVVLACPPDGVTDEAHPQPGLLRIMHRLHHAAASPESAPASPSPSGEASMITPAPTSATAPTAAPGASFLQLALEAALHGVLAQLGGAVAEAQPRVAALAEALRAQRARSSHNKALFGEVKALKAALAELASSAVSVQSAVTDVLDSAVELRALADACAPATATSINASEGVGEIEALLESYATQAQGVASSIKLLRAAVDAAQEEVELVVDATTNRLLTFELTLLTVMMVFTCINFVGALLSMNLVNGFNIGIGDPDVSFRVFLAMCIAAAVGLAALSAALIAVFRRLMS